MPTLEEYLRELEGPTTSTAPVSSTPASPSAVGLDDSDNMFADLLPTREASRPLLPPQRPTRGPFSQAWRTITTPLRVLTGVTGSVGGQAARLFDPAGYEEARKEREAEVLDNGPSRDLRWYEEAQALPGLGDVIATHIPQDSTLGRIARPVTQVIGDIAGDPTSWIGPGLLTGVGRATRAISKAGAALEAAERVGDASKVAEIAARIPTLQDALEAARAGETGIGRAVRGVEEGVAGLGGGGAAAREAIQNPSLRNIGRVTASIPFGPVPALAYAPELLGGIYEGGRRTVEDLRQGNYSDAAASGVGALMSTAMAAMVARGLIHETHAAGVLDRLQAYQREKTAPPPMTPPPELPIGPPRVGEATQAFQERPQPAGPGETLPPQVPPQGAPAEVPPAPQGREVVPPRAEPIPTPAPEPEPAPVLESKLEHDKHQNLQDFLDEAQSTSTPITIKALEEKGILTPGQANTARKTGLGNVLGSEVMARLEHEKGKGYRVKAAPARTTENPAGAVATAGPPEAGVAAATESTPTVSRPQVLSRDEIDRQLEDPQARALANEALDRVMAERGKSLQELGPQDVREVFPGEENKATRATLNRVLHARKVKMRMAADLETAMGEGGGGTPAAATEGVAAPTIAREGGAEVPARPAPTTLPPAEVSSERINPTPTPPVPFPPREGPRGLDIHIPAPTPPIPTDQRAPVTRVGTGEDSGITRQQVERMAGRATTAGAAIPTRPPAEGSFPAYPRESTTPVTPLTSELTAQVGQRLAGGQDLARPTPDSPLGQINRQRPRVRNGERVASDDDIQNAVTRWLETASNPAPESLSPVQQRIRHLLTDAPDTPQTRSELTKLLVTEVKNKGGAAVQQDKRGRTVPIYDESGKLAYDRADAIEDVGRSGLANAEVARTAIVEPTGIAKIDETKANPEYPDRPPNLTNKEYYERITPAEISQYRGAAKWALEEMKTAGPTRTGRAGATTPWMDVLRPMAQQLGIPFDPQRGGERLIRQIARKLDKIERGNVDAAVTPLLTDSLVAQRGSVWKGRIESSPKIGDTDARVVDLEGDFGNGTAVRDLQNATGLAEELVRATSGFAASAEAPSHFGGFTPSPQLNGVRVKDAVYLNLNEAHARGTALGLKDQALADFIARDLLHTTRHEIAHAKARHDAATGDDAFIDSFARVMEDTEPVYDAAYQPLRERVREILPQLDAMAPAYSQAREKLYGTGSGASAGVGAESRGVEGVGGGTSGRRIAPIPPRPGGAAGGAAGNGGAGVRPGGAVPARGGAGAAPREGNPTGVEGAATGTLGGTRGAGAGVQPAAAEGRGTAEIGTAPAGSLTTKSTISPEDKARAEEYESSLTAAQRRYAENAARTAGNPTAASDLLRHFESIKTMSPQDRMKLRASLPRSSFDLSSRFQKLGDVLSDSQRSDLAAIDFLHQHDPARATPMTWEKVDQDTRKLLNLRSPSDFNTLSKRAGLKSEADFHALRTALDSFTAETNDARMAAVDAMKSSDPTVAAKAQDDLGVAYARRLNAIAALAPPSEPTSKVLRALRVMAHGLQPDESFRTRFFGALDSTGVKREKADQLWGMYQDSINYERAHGIPGAMGQTFQRAFLDAIKPTMWDKITEFWKAGLLGIPTQITNTTGNVSFLPYRNLEHGLTVMADKFISDVTGAPRTRYMNEITGRLMGQRDAMRDVLPMLQEGLSDMVHLRPLSPEMQGGGFTDTRRGLKGLYGAIGGKMGEAIRAPFKGLDLGDDVVKHVIRMGEFGARAGNLAHDIKMRTPGESVQHASNRIYQELKRIASDPGHNWSLFEKEFGSDKTKVYKDTLEAAHQSALQDTWQKSLQGLGRGVDEFVKSHPAFEFLLPFRKTPYNILGEGLKRTPLGALHTIYQGMAGKIDRPEFLDRMVQSALGTTMMGVAASFALDGTLTGSGPDDPKLNAELRRTGWLPRSIKVGNQYISYSRVEPFATVLGLAADLADAWKSKDTDTSDEILRKLSAATTDNILDKSFLTGMKSMIDVAMGDPGEKAAAIRQLQASMVPGQVGLVVPVSQLARAIDPYYRETEAFSLSPFLAQIPGASTTLMPQYNPSGEIRTRPGTALERFISPFQRSEVKDDPISEASGELARLGKAIERPELYLRVGTDKLYYSPEERDEIGQAQQRAMEKIAQVIQSPTYQALPDEESVEYGTKRKTKSDIINDVRNRYVGPVKQRIDRMVMARARGKG